MALSTDAIISIRPLYAEAILTHRKKVELRRRIPDTPRGTRLWIYATKPVAAIVGTARVAEVARGAPRDLWATYKDDVAVSRSVFFEYFEGTDQGIAMVLEDIARSIPIDIARLRQVLQGFHPPQVLSRITKSDAVSLEKWLRVA